MAKSLSHRLMVLLMIYLQQLITTGGQLQGLQVTCLPSVLFEYNGGIHNVVPSSVIQMFCSVDSHTAIFTWMKTGSVVVSSPPHLHIRTWNNNTTSTSVLTVDGFNAGDDGTYQCLAEDHGRYGNGTVVALTVNSRSDGELVLTDEPANKELSFELSDIYRDNRSGIALGSTISGDLLTCEAIRSGNSTSLPMVSWIRNGELISNSSGFSSSLEIIDFTIYDAGVYQCVFIDTDASAEIVTTVPYRLDTDMFSDFNGANFNTITAERVSPRLIFLRPPKKLVIEVKVKGRYSRILWHRNGTSVSHDQASLINFKEIYAVEETSTLDFGHYQVIPNSFPPTIQLVRPAELNFIVTSPVSAYTRGNYQHLAIDEGQSINISCNSTGSPTPTIYWEMNNNPVQFTATEISVEPQVSERGFLQDVMLGSINSTLHISNAQYPRDSGYFVCFGTNDDAMINYSNFSIFLQVIVEPVIEVVTSHTKVRIGATITLFCNVVRTNPEISSYEWTHENKGILLSSSNSIDRVLSVNLTTLHDFGTFICTLTNAAGRSASGNVTIVQGNIPEVLAVQPPPVFSELVFVQLICIVSGEDPPHNITWSFGEMEVYFTTQTTGLNITLGISRLHYGEYTCTATNEFGAGASNIYILPPEADLPRLKASISVTSPTTDECSEAMILTCVETSFSDLITTIRPNITWYSYNGDPVPVSGNPRVISGTGQLLFSELTSRNSGDYTCRASLSIPVAGINNLYNDTTFFVTDNVPGIVQNLTCNGSISPRDLYLSWSEPVEETSSIMGYRVKVLEVEHRNNETRILQSVQLTPPYNKEITFRQIRITNGLDSGVPYNITVKAVNVAGCGLERQIYCFTQEKVPPRPENVTAVRLNSTTISISWTKLSLVELKGLATYVIKYTIINATTMGFQEEQFTDIVNVSWTERGVLLSKLPPNSGLNITVKILTTAGESDAVEVYVFASQNSTPPNFNPIMIGTTAIVGFLAAMIIICATIMTIIIVIVAIVLRRHKTKQNIAQTELPVEMSVIESDDNAEDYVDVQLGVEDDVNHQYDTVNYCNETYDEIPAAIPTLTTESEQRHDQLTSTTEGYDLTQCPAYVPATANDKQHKNASSS